jgi:hypothetical protein
MRCTWFDCTEICTRRVPNRSRRAQRIENQRCQRPVPDIRQSRAQLHRDVHRMSRLQRWTRAVRHARFSSVLRLSSGARHHAYEMEARVARGACAQPSPASLPDYSACTQKRKPRSSKFHIAARTARERRRARSTSLDSAELISVPDTSSRSHIRWGEVILLCSDERTTASGAEAGSVVLGAGAARCDARPERQTSSMIAPSSRWPASTPSATRRYFASRWEHSPGSPQWTNSAIRPACGLEMAVDP